MIIGSKILFFKNLPSTNTYAANFLKKNNLREGTVIHTNYQSAGKGQMGNKWESEDGKNLLMSIVVFPFMIDPTDQFQISMTISLGICDFLQRHIPVCSIKWPNDIYVNNDKIAGILIENSIMDNRIENTIAGIGLNINQEKFIEGAPNPVSLKMITGKDFDLEMSINDLSIDIDKRYQQLITGSHHKIKEEYINKLYRFNEWSQYRDQNGLFSGRIIAVADSGRLSIESDSGRFCEYGFKEVDFIL
jgi:BirA family biotin operon repressor/biotin-[acetyl-CoA-carboxylase] ligase